MTTGRINQIACFFFRCSARGQNRAGRALSSTPAARRAANHGRIFKTRGRPVDLRPADTRRLSCSAGGHGDPPSCVPLAGTRWHAGTEDHHGTISLVQVERPSRARLSAPGHWTRWARSERRAGSFFSPSLAPPAADRGATCPRGTAGREGSAPVGRPTVRRSANSRRERGEPSLNLPNRGSPLRGPVGCWHSCTHREHPMHPASLASATTLRRVCAVRVECPSSTLTQWTALQP